jgi:hypothetical protein
MGFLEIVSNLRRLCLCHHVRPDKVKITIEFLDPSDQYNAETALLSSNNGIMIFSHNMAEIVTQGREFTLMGFRAQVKKFSHPDCDCPIC